MKISLNWIMGIVIATTLGLGAAEAGQSGPIETTVKLERAGETSLFVSIKIENKGDKNLDLADAFLPWNSWSNMRFFLFYDKMNRLKEIPRIDDPVGAKTSLKPGEFIEGKLRLDERFPGLLLTLKKADVEMFWSWNPHLNDGTVLKSCGGFLLLDRIFER